MKVSLMIFALLFARQVLAKPISFMQYNVENFFDTTHDEGKEDWTYLPKQVKSQTPQLKEECHKLSTSFYIQECLELDWNEAKFTKKILNIAKVIKSFDQSGKGADIVMLEEVENINVLSKLVSKGLDGLGYQYKALTEGDDTRGIDVGLISKYPIINAKRHPLIINGRKEETRGILQVTLKVGTQEITVFVNHWPSQSNPTEQRIASAKLLDSVAASLNSDLILAAGDFNTLENENPKPFNHLSNWVDLEPEAKKLGVKTNPGTHFYRGEWSSLDHIFIHKKSASTTNYQSFQIIHHSFMLKRDARSGEMVPNRFNFETAEGFSDHLPMGIVINLK
jgi:endonuclease/exonuclease/phosphatase family metal-dependent hydrolase